jgi:segregation and condensation protein B
MLTRPAFGGWLRRVHQAPPGVRLSQPALETLAIVAYRQPVPRSRIEAIRGVQCDEVLRQLLERDLVRIAGRAEELGRPLLYATTKTFLQRFGLKSPAELPRAEELRRSFDGAPDDTPPRRTADGSTNHEKGLSEESAVTIAVSPRRAEPTEPASPLAEERRRAAIAPPPAVVAAGDDDEEFEDDEESDEDDDFEDDDEEEEEDDDEDWDEDDEGWEEVDDEESDEEDDDEDDDDWDEDDDEDDDWEEEEEAGEA